MTSRTRASEEGRASSCSTSTPLSRVRRLPARRAVQPAAAMAAATRARQRRVRGGKGGTEWMGERGSVSACIQGRRGRVRRLLPVVERPHPVCITHIYHFGMGGAYGVHTAAHVMCEGHEFFPLG